MEKGFATESIERIFKHRFSFATHVQLLWKGKETFQTIFDAVSRAEKFVCLQFYIFRNDETGTALSRLLKKKSREGVKVYILYDHFGSLGTPRSFWKEMKRRKTGKVIVAYAATAFIILQLTDILYRHYHFHHGQSLWLFSF
jgi:cardiolipin synthase